VTVDLRASRPRSSALGVVGDIEVYVALEGIVDLAAERGGNCELTHPNETVVEHGVTIIGSFNLASTAPYHASQMYSRNITTFFVHLLREGKLRLDLEDEITRETLVTRGGEVVHPRVRELLSLAPAATAAAGSA